MPSQANGELRGGKEGVERESEVCVRGKVDGEYREIQSLKHFRICLKKQFHVRYLMMFWPKKTKADSLDITEEGLSQFSDVSLTILMSEGS